MATKAVKRLAASAVLLVSLAPLLRHVTTKGSPAPNPYDPVVWDARVAAETKTVTYEVAAYGLVLGSAITSCLILGVRRSP